MTALFPQSFDHINSFFDHVYVLSLKRATNRHDQLQKNLKGLDWSFFWGVDKIELNEQNVLDTGIYDDSGHRSLKRTHRSMSLGEIACALSHRGIYQDILEKGYQNALILEDDVMPNPDADAKFRNALAQLPQNWELLMLGYYSEKYAQFFSILQRQVYMLYHYLNIANWQKVERRYIRQMLMQRENEAWYRIGKLVGGHGYAVSRSACEKFIKLQTPIVLQADRIFSHLALLGDLKAYGIKEKIFGLSELAQTSYIEYPGLAEKISSLSGKSKTQSISKVTT